MASQILTQDTDKAKWHAAMLFLLSLKPLKFLLLICGFILAVLLVFSLLLDAFSELCFHIAQVWNGSGAIERLLILVLTYFFLRSVAPVAIRLYRRGF